MTKQVIYYAIANAIDYCLTCMGLAVNKQVEGNPLAACAIRKWGLINGLFYYKLIMLSIVIGVGVIVYRKYPRLVNWILNVGIFLTLIGGLLWLWEF